MRHKINGRWYLTSSKHVDELLQVTGCTTKIRKKIVPLLTATGPTGHVEDCIIDLEQKAARLCIYSNDVLFHEYVTPFDTVVPVWGHTEKFEMLRAHVDSEHKVSGNLHGESHVQQFVWEVTEDVLTQTWTCGDVVCTMTFAKMQP